MATCKANAGHERRQAQLVHLTRYNLLPAAVRDIRLPIWSPLADRALLLQLAGYLKKYGVTASTPNVSALVPNYIFGGKTLEGAVGNRYVLLRLNGRPVTRLGVGWYTFVVADRSAKQNFHLKGPGLNKKTGTRQVGRLSFTTTLAKGVYTYSSDANPKLKGSFRVT